MNILDLIIIGVIALCALNGFRRGLIKTVFRFISFFAAIFLAGRLYPLISRILRETPLYASLTEAVKNSLGLQSFFRDSAQMSQAELFNNLPFPQGLLDMLTKNNNFDMYELLRVSTVEDYIGGFFANIILNIIAMAAVFFAVLIIMSIIGGVLDIVGKLPVINTFNRAGGLAAGLLIGTAVTWLLLAAASLLFATPANEGINQLVEGSLIAKKMFDGQFLLNWVSKF